MKMKKQNLILLLTAPVLALAAIGTVGGVNSNQAATEVLANYDATTHKDAFDFKFSTIGSSGWTSSYGKHSVESDVGEVIFAEASKQTSNIKDYPVNKNKAITYTLKDKSKYTITAVKLECQQWTNKTQTIGLKTSTDGTNFTALSNTSTNFTLDVSDLSAKAVEFTFNESSQIGIKALTVTLAPAVVAKKTVSLVTNCDQTIDSFEVDEGSKISGIDGQDSLTKDGYTLNGWTKDDKWRNPWIFNTDTVTEDITLYADWVKEGAERYSLTFDTDGGNEAYTEQTVYEDHYFTTVENPTKNSDDLYSYTFAGWYELDENADYLSEPFDFSSPATRNVELFAKWDAHLLVDNETFFSGTDTFANLAFTYESTTTEVQATTTSLPSAGSWGNESAQKSGQLKEGDITISWSKGAKYEETLRIYSGATLTVSAPSKISKIVINGNTSGANAISNFSTKTGTYKGGVWTGESTEVVFTASAQTRLQTIVVTYKGGGTATYSDFENAKLQFRYDLNSLSQGDKNKIKKAQEAGLFITDDASFNFSSKPTTLDVAEGKIGRKYHNVEGKDFDLTVGIAIPEEKYGTELYAASYLLMPNGKYYFNKPKHYSVNSILQQYAYGNVLTDATQKAICVAFATSLGLTANN